MGKEYVKVVYRNPTYLTSRQSTSCKMPCWMKHKLESRLLGEISITSDMQMTLPWNFLLYIAPMVLSTVFPQYTRTFFFLLLLFKYASYSIIWKTIHMCFFLLFSCLNKWPPKEISEQNEPPKARLTDTIITNISEFCMLEFYNTVDELRLSVEPGILCSSPQKSKHPDLLSVISGLVYVFIQRWEDEHFRGTLSKFFGSGEFSDGEVKWKSLSCVQLFAISRTIWSMEFSRAEYWSG